MKRYAKVAVAGILIATLAVDTVSACWLFARRARWTTCRPCPPAYYNYNHCVSGSGPRAGSNATTGFSFVPDPSSESGGAEGTTIMSPSMRIPWEQAQPGTQRRPPAPTNVPSGRGAPTEPDRTETRREPMPESTERSTETTEPTPQPRIDPMTEAPSATRGQPGAEATEAPAPMRTEEPTPMPSATEPDDPFAPRPQSTRPTEPAAPADDPFAPRGTTTPTPPAGDDPFAPRGDATKAPPAETPSETPATPPLDDPFSPAPDATKSAPDSAAPAPTIPPANATTPATPPADDSFTPRANETKSTLGDPFAPAAGQTKSSTTETPAADPFAPTSTETKAPETQAPETKAPLDDPFAPKSDAATTPMTQVEPMPMPMDDTKDADTKSEPASEPAKDDPFAEPTGPKLSADQPVDSIRTWTDVTGKHQVRGRMKLILLAENKVRILKTTGKYTTVPLSKLSLADRQFVAVHSTDQSVMLAESK